MARLRVRSTSPDPESRESMLALRERKLARKWAAFDRDRPLMWAAPGLDGDERCLIVFPDGSVREAFNDRPSWKRDRLDGRTEWHFVDTGEPIPDDAGFW